MELRQRSSSRHPPHPVLPRGSGFPDIAVSRHFRADSAGPTLAALVRRRSQFFENRTWHKGCTASGVVKNANQRPPFRQRCFAWNPAGSCAGGHFRFPDVLLYRMGFTASLNQWRGLRPRWTGVGNHRERCRLILWQGTSRQENGEWRNL